MSESAAVQLDMLKPHVQAILEEVRRAGPEACRRIRDEVEERVPEELRLSRDVGSPDCAGLHVLAAVAWQISVDQFVDGHTDAAFDTALEAISYSSQADVCEQAH